MRGYAYQSDFDKAGLARDTSAQNPRQLISMLLAGRIDIIVGDRTQLLYFAREQRAQHNVRILPRPLVQMPRYVAFAKGDKVRAERFAEALSACGPVVSWTASCSSGSSSAPTAPAGS